MKFFFVDDSKVDAGEYSREQINKLVAVGGIIVDSSCVRKIEIDLEKICSGPSFKVPISENIKWSPSPKSWLRKNLNGDQRHDLYKSILDCLVLYDASVVVAICDPKYRKANKNASDSEMDATLLAFERFSSYLRSEPGMVVISRPGGGPRENDKFVFECIEHKNNGTNFVNFSNFAVGPVTMLSAHSRLLQAADLVVSITNIMVSGDERFAAQHFSTIAKMMVETKRGVKGGAGLKIHPSMRYRNLYHWLLKDQYFVQGSTGNLLPQSGFPYSQDARR